MITGLIAAGSGPERGNKVLAFYFFYFLIFENLILLFQRQVIFWNLFIIFGN
jgi:hypothetical protein